MVVESGSLTVEVDGPVMVTRGAGMGEAMATAEATGDFSAMMESIAAGEAVTLAAGDAAYIPGNVLGEIRNESQARGDGAGLHRVPLRGHDGRGDTNALTRTRRRVPERCNLPFHGQAPIIRSRDGVSGRRVLVARGRHGGPFRRSRAPLAVQLLDAFGNDPPQPNRVATR